MLLGAKQTLSNNQQQDFDSALLSYLQNRINKIAGQATESIENSFQEQCKQEGIHTIAEVIDQGRLYHYFTNNNSPQSNLHPYKKLDQAIERMLKEKSDFELKALPEVSITGEVFNFQKIQLERTQTVLKIKKSKQNRVVKWLADKGILIGEIRKIDRFLTKVDSQLKEIEEQQKSTQATLPRHSSSRNLVYNQQKQQETTTHPSTAQGQRGSQDLDPTPPLLGLTSYKH